MVQTQSYGIASRGGFSLAEVIIDQEEIIYQQVQEPDIILTLTEEALEKYAPFAEKQGVRFFTIRLWRRPDREQPDRLSLYANRQRPGKCGFRQHPFAGGDDHRDPDGKDGKPGPGDPETFQGKGPGDESAGAGGGHGPDQERRRERGSHPEEGRNRQPPAGRPVRRVSMSPGISGISETGSFAEALAVIRERIPFPFVCGYACVHPCETKCARTSVR